MRDCLILECSQITGAIVQLRGTDLPQAFRVNEHHRQVHVRSFALHAALHDHGGAQLAESRCRIADFVGADNTRGNNPKGLLCGLQIRKLVGHRIHQAFRDRRVVGIVAGIGEGQDGDVFFATGVGQSGKSFAHRRKEGCHDNYEDHANRCEEETPGLGRRAGAPARAGGIFNILL